MASLKAEVLLREFNYNSVRIPSGIVTGPGWEARMQSSVR